MKHIDEIVMNEINEERQSDMELYYQFTNRFSTLPRNVKSKQLSPRLKLWPPHPRILTSTS